MSVHPTDQPASRAARLVAAPRAEEQGAPGRLRRGLSGVIRRRWIRVSAAIRSLVTEQVHIGGTRPASTASYGETVIRGLGKAAGDRALGKTQRPMSSLARKAWTLRARQAELHTRAGFRDGDLVAHPDGGVRTVVQAADDQDKQREQIAADIDRGSTRHRRLPLALRRVPPLVFGADTLLLLYFFSGVTNVNWESPLSAALAFAALLAAMVTGMSFAFFSFAGDRLQQYKDDTGVIPLRGLDEATTVSMMLALAAMIILAALMFTRMRAEVTIALGPRADGTALILGLVLALVSILANTLVVAVHALDGSAETGRLDAFGASVRGPLAQQHRMREQAAVLEQRIAVIGREAERVAAAGITSAGCQVAAAERLIDAARAVHQGTGQLSEPAANPNDEAGVTGSHRADGHPRVDERPLRLALDHTRTPLGEQADKGAMR